MSDRDGQERVLITFPIDLCHAAASRSLAPLLLPFVPSCTALRPGLYRRDHRRPCRDDEDQRCDRQSYPQSSSGDGHRASRRRYSWIRSRLPQAQSAEAPAGVPAPTTPVPAEPSPRPAAPPAVGETAASARVEGEFLQFLGATRNGAVAGTRVADDWAARPPKQLWRRPIGAGWSGFAVAGSVAVTQEQRGDREMVVAYSLADGLPMWSHGDVAHYESTIAGEGPRATPTISRGRVFTLGSTGLLNCLDLETGKAMWRRDIAADNDSPPPDFGRSSSPLIVDDLVVVSAGGSPGRSLVAYRRESGEPSWRAGDDLASYSSPVLADAGWCPTDCRAQSVERRRPRSGHRTRALDVMSGRVQRRRLRFRSLCPRIVSCSHPVRRWQPAPADFARWRRREPDARVGEHAAQGQVHQPGRPRRLRVRIGRWRAGVCRPRHR